MILIRNFYHSLRRAWPSPRCSTARGSSPSSGGSWSPLDAGHRRHRTVTGVGYWNMFFYVVIFITKPQFYTFQVKLNEIISVQQQMETQIDQMLSSTNASRGT